MVVSAAPVGVPPELSSSRELRPARLCGCRLWARSGTGEPPEPPASSTASRHRAGASCRTASPSRWRSPRPGAAAILIPHPLIYRYLTSKRRKLRVHITRCSPPACTAKDGSGCIGAPTPPNPGYFRGGAEEHAWWPPSFEKKWFSLPLFCPFRIRPFQGIIQNFYFNQTVSMAGGTGAYLSAGADAGRAYIKTFPPSLPQEHVFVPPIAQWSWPSRNRGRN